MGKQRHDFVSATSLEHHLVQYQHLCWYLQNLNESVQNVFTDTDLKREYERTKDNVFTNNLSRVVDSKCRH